MRVGRHPTRVGTQIGFQASLTTLGAVSTMTRENPPAFACVRSVSQNTNDNGIPLHRFPNQWLLTRYCCLLGEPGDSGGYDPTGQVHCTRGGWADYPCSTPYRYICGTLRHLAQPSLLHLLPAARRIDSTHANGIAAAGAARRRKVVE